MMRYGDFLRLYGTGVGFLVVFAGFAIFADNFLTTANQLTILKQISTLAMIAIGFTLALMAAELDLSFAHVASLSAVVCGGLVHGKVDWRLAILAALAVGTLFGVLNGLLVTRLKVPSLIATLATSSIANGLAFMATGGVAFVGRWNADFLALGRAKILDVPVLILWMALALVVVQVVVKETRLGLRLVSTGEAEDAARLSGIDVRGMKVMGLALSGFFAALTAVMLTASLSSASPTTASDYLMTGIAAVLLGMTTIEPGKPNIPGTFIGALIIGTLSNGLVLLGAPYYVQDIVLGIIIILSVAISASRMTRAAFGVGR